MSTKPIAPGQTAQLDAALPPGHYLMASSILSDQALGAYGTLIVALSLDPVLQEPCTPRRTYGPTPAPAVRRSPPQS